MSAPGRDMAPRHGGDVEGFRERWGREPLDFSACANPLGLHPAAREAAEEALETADRYPDPRCRALTRVIASVTGVPEERVVCASGASDAFDRAVRSLAPRRSLLLEPTFSEYEASLARAGSRLSRHFLLPEEGFALDESILPEVEGCDAVVVCEPDNPTGRLAGRGLMERLLERCEEEGAVLVVDECFIGFTEDPLASSMRSLVPSHPALVVIDAFTKLYGMAGLRVGYALVGDEGLARRMREDAPPWGVSSIAQAAGASALAAGGEWLEETRALVERERPRLSRRLAELGCEVFPSDANFLLFRCARAGLCEALAREGIMVRDCSDFAGLSPGYYRVGVRTEAEDDLLLEALERVLGR